jgi:hypothetical protein
VLRRSVDWELEDISCLRKKHIREQRHCREWSARANSNGAGYRVAGLRQFLRATRCGGIALAQRSWAPTVSGPFTRASSSTSISRKTKNPDSIRHDRLVSALEL